MSPVADEPFKILNLNGGNFYNWRGGGDPLSKAT